MQQKESERPAKRSKGAILLFTTILLFVILGMVVSLSYVTVMEQKMSGKTKSSVGSFYNAESGVEWVLNKMANTTKSTIVATFGSDRFNTDGSVKCPDAFGTTETCKVYLLDQDGKMIVADDDISTVKAVRSVGTQGGETQRAIEAAVASTTGGGCYVSYGAPRDTPAGHRAAAPNGNCITGFIDKGVLGWWGMCSWNGSDTHAYFFKPPEDSGCGASFSNGNFGDAFLCCQN